MPIIIKNTDSKAAIASPELDHRIEVGSAEYHELLSKMPAVGDAAGSIVLIMPKTDAWKIDPKQGKWKFTLDGDTYLRFEDGIRLQTKIEIEGGNGPGLKDFIRERARKKPELATRDVQDPPEWSWDSAVNQIGWPDYEHLAVRTKFTSQAAASPQIRGFGATSGCYIGNGLVLTCGHEMRRIYEHPRDFMVIFGWNREVEKRYFSRWAIADIDRFVAWDEYAHREPTVSEDDQPPTYMTEPSFEHLKDDARKWDGAIIKLNFAENPERELKGLTIAPLPATFDDILFSAGCPLGSQVKISPDLKVLRYNINWDNKSWDSRTINDKPMVRFTTNVENFGGQSGGPVVNSATGQIVGIISMAPTSSTAERLDSKDPLNEGNDAMRNLNRHIMNVEGKNFQKDGLKYIPKGKALQQSDLHEIVAPWVICRKGDRMLDGSTNNGPDFTYLVRYPENCPEIYNLNLSCRADKYALMLTPIETILKNPEQYHINSVTIMVEVPSAVSKEPALALQSSWGTANAPVTTTSVNVDGGRDINHRWGTKFTNRLVSEPLINGAPALPLDLTKSPLGIIDWTAFSVKADPKTNLEGEQFRITVIYSRAAFRLGKVDYPAEEIQVINGGPLHKDAPDAPYKPTLYYWMTPAP